MDIILYWGVRNYNDRRPLEPLSDAVKTVPISGVNFIYNDGIETVQTVNIDAGEYTTSFPSYMTCSDGSEWFVLASVKNRQGQLTLTLHRNLLSEHWDALQIKPFIFRRASDIDGEVFNPARYLKTTSLSQVKTKEIYVRDSEQSNGWIIGYINKDVPSADISVSKNAYSYDYLVDSLSDWEYYNAEKITDRICLVSWRCSMGTTLAKVAQINVTRGLSTSLTYDYTIDDSPACNYILPGVDTEVHKERWLASRSLMINDINKALNEVITARTRSVSAEVGDLSFLDNKIIAAKVSDNNIVRYRIKVTRTQRQDVDFSADDATVMYNNLYDRTYSKLGGTVQPFKALTAADTKFGTINFSYVRQKVTLTRLNEEAISVAYRLNHAHTADALYDVFAIPLGGQFTYLDAAGKSHVLKISTDKKLLQEKIMLLVTKLYETWGTQLIDIQWLPYGPVQGGYRFISAQSSDYPNYAYSLIMEGGTPISLMYWCQTSQYQYQIAFDQDLLSLPSSVLTLAKNSEARVWNEEHLVRLVSPNFASQFEFSPIKNDGLTGFNIYLAYKPYSPYVRVAPIFSGLYGHNYNDDRGLILSGDFSLDRISDAWTQYRLQNKNYQLIFDRQIQSMDLQNEYQDRLDSQSAVQDVFSAIGGTVQGASQGAMAGGMLGGGVGAIIGGVTGAATALGTGIADAVTNAGNRKMAKAIRDDNRQAAIDQFQYQIGNIKAMPNTVTKIATFNPDYKVYPVLEIYTCTDQEDSNYRASVEWNGFDLEVIAQLNAADSGFIAGSVLRFDGLSLNASETRDINDELAQGVYLT